MNDRKYTNAITNFYKLRDKGVLNLKNHNSWLNCLKIINDYRIAIIKDKISVIKLKLFIDLLPNAIYDYFKYEIDFATTDKLLKELQDSQIKGNVKLHTLENKPVDKITTFEARGSVVKIAKVKPIVKIENDNITPFVIPTVRKNNPTKIITNVITTNVYPTKKSRLTKNNETICNIINDYYHKKDITDNIYDIKLSLGDIIDLVNECEEKLNIQIGYNITNIKTVSGFIEYVEDIVNN